MSVSLSQGIAKLRDFDGRLLQQSVKQAFYRALDVGRKSAVTALRRSKIGVMVERRGNVQLQLGLSSKTKYSQSELNAMRLSVIPLIVRRMEVKRNYAGNLGITATSGLSGGLESEGFASLIQVGGRTKSHQIKRIREGGYSKIRRVRERQVAKLPPLTFQVGGRWISKRIVTHPGSRVPRNPILDTGAQVSERALNQEFQRSLGEAVQKAGL